MLMQIMVNIWRIFWASKFRPCSTNLLRRGYAADWQVREVQVVVKWGGELTVPRQISAAVVTEARKWGFL